MFFFRLEAYDRNKDFGNQDEVGEEYSMTLPDSILYKDFNSGTEFVDFKMETIEVYLKPMDKVLGSDAKYLYKEKFLRYIRLAKYDNTFFVKSECRAQMKRTVSYKIDVAINENGSVDECQCECAVGMGPSAHCKHVCCLLLALHNFSSNGEIVSEETCTQRLQTFHHSKPYKGSPIKANSLPLANKKGSEVQFDPRPEKYRNCAYYNDYFRNVCLNHRGVSKFPISQLYPPANVYAVASDHDYLEGHPEDRWLKDASISQISEDRVKYIESSTTGQSKNKIWKQERCKRLTASNFGRICKATNRTNFNNLADSLTVMKDIKTSAILHGRKYESIALAKYESECGRGTRQCGIFVSSSHPYIGASPDAVIDDQTLLEIKCPFVVRNQMITTKTVPFLKEKDGLLILDNNHDYFYQIQGQLFCTNAKKCILVIYTFCDFKSICIERDDFFIDNMVKKLKEFYDNYFKSAVLQRLFYKEYNKYTFD